MLSRQFYSHKLIIAIVIIYYLHNEENLKVNSFHTHTIPSSYTVGSNFKTFIPYLDKTKHFNVKSRLAVSTSLSNDVRIQSKDLNELLSNDVVIIKDFIPPSLIKELRNDIDNLRDDTRFRIAKIGQDSTNELNTDIRVAETCFIGRNKLQDSPLNSNRDKLYDILDTLCSDLSKNSVVALDGSLNEFLYAFYPKGGFYRRHRDAIPNSASVLRQYSLLLYLNDNWTEDDGGQLRTHRDGGGDFLPEGQEPNYIDVEPRGGTLVLFKSDKIPHEVLDTNSKRYAVVGWYNRKVTPSDILSVGGSDGDSSIRLIMLAASAALVTVGLASILS